MTTSKKTPSRKKAAAKKAPGKATTRQRSPEPKAVPEIVTQESKFYNARGALMQAKTLELVSRAHELYWESKPWSEIAEILREEGVCRRSARTCKDIPTEFKSYWEHLNAERKETTIQTAERNAVNTMRDMCLYQSPLFMDEQAKQDWEAALADADPEHKADLLLGLNKEHRADAYVRLRTASVALTRIRGITGVSISENNFNFNFSEEEIKKETEDVGHALLSLGKEMKDFAKGGNGHDEDYVN